MAAEDRVKRDVRQSVRTLEELRQRFEIKRRNTRFGARELSLSIAPDKPGRQSGLSIQGAMRSVRLSSNDLVNFWLDYETTRLNLFRDMGTMEIDSTGIWPDPFYERLRAEPNPTNPPNN